MSNGTVSDITVPVSYAELPHCPISSSPAAAVAFPGSDIRAFIGPFTIRYLYWLPKCRQRFEYKFKLWAYSVTNYDLNVTKYVVDYFA